MINLFHNWLDLPKFSKAWYESDLKDELQEFRKETKLLKKWSELSDITYTVSRSRWSNNHVDSPINSLQYLLGMIYMVPKYSSRYLFYRTAGRRAGADKDVKWLRNPYKLHKLAGVVSEQGISVDVELMQQICEKQRKYWPLLP